MDDGVGFVKFLKELSGVSCRGWYGVNDICVVLLDDAWDEIDKFVVWNIVVKCAF